MSELSWRRDGELIVNRVREKARPIYRIVEYTPDAPGYWEQLNRALPRLRFPHHSGAFPDGYLIIDQAENVVVGWCSSLDSFTSTTEAPLR